ncbi:hypothetical protein JNK13_05385 [bacterium]|nr:hypothetical protein [bacterium]
MSGLKQQLKDCPIELADQQGNIARFGKLVDMNRSFDIKYWQQKTTSERMRAAWGLVVYALQRKEQIKDEPRLQRAVTSFQRQSR